MGVGHGFAVALLVCGSAVLLLSVLALVVLPTPYSRLHALAPASSLGIPLICLALALDAGGGREAVKLLFIGGLAALSGPVLAIVIGRTMAREGEIPTEIPTDIPTDVPKEPPT
ncbi:cation:proton antiporter [Streptomyces sp. NBC_01190]|uniref:cation:proton antiporter n=1 Tax=Streptomyces sp. NBC_01190 TaxID=2903767 RepID=UPI00386E4568|nr:monovalent cation/H(+) antiporter subunit G [Streptomyces sp. NBC_01190]